jgi:hypothetical protein
MPRRVHIVLPLVCLFSRRTLMPGRRILLHHTNMLFMSPIAASLLIYENY